MSGIICRFWGIGGDDRGDTNGDEGRDKDGQYFFHDFLLGCGSIFPRKVCGL